MTEANADQITYWNEVAGAKWVANQARLDRVFMPLTQALIEAAAPALDERVIDIGCGCGETSLLAARRAGPAGHVLAVDISRPMLAHARTRAAATLPGTTTPIDWLEADAMTHAFAPEADLMISRFGVMFFADASAAFANIRRALKPGGRFAFMTWRPRSQVAWMQWPLDQIAAVLPPPAETTGDPGPFGLADATATIQLLRAAGFSAVTADPVDAMLTLGAGAAALDDAMTLLLDTGPAAALMRDAEPDARREADNLLRRAVAELQKDEAVQLTGGCWLYRGVA